MKEIELRSEEIQDILTRPPSILVRSGISVICGVVVLLIAGSFFFKYPDKATGAIILTTENPPVWLVAQTSGKIKELNCTDKSEVWKGQVLAVIENPAESRDIMQVKNQIKEFTASGWDSTLVIPEELQAQALELGSIQNAYSQFIRTRTNYQNFLSFNTTTKEKEALELQIKGHKRYSQTLYKQLQMKQEEMQLAKAAHDREKQLFQKGVISQAEMDAAENAYLNTRQSQQQLQSGMASDQIEAAQLEEALIKLDTQYQKEKNSLLSELNTAIRELSAAIENWEQLYQLVSPMDGTVTFNSFWAKNQFVKAGEKVLAIVSSNSGAIIGRIQTQAQSSGKIKESQRVIIKVQGYPYMEYGTLQGTVKNISLIANEQVYSIEVELPQGLTTTTGKILPFSGELTGEAEIITDERSVANRILAPLEYLLREQGIAH